MGHDAVHVCHIRTKRHSNQLQHRACLSRAFFDDDSIHGFPLLASSVSSSSFRNVLLVCTSLLFLSRAPTFSCTAMLLVLFILNKFC
jgi:hypothetical protein